MKTILYASEIDEKLDRMAEEIIEKNSFLKEIILLGIERRGVPLAHRLAEKIRKASALEVRVGSLDITLYGADHRLIAKFPVLGGTNIPFPIDNGCVVLVDDILYTGKTVITAMQELLQNGKPEEVQLAVFIDHGRRSFPVCADYVGIKTEVQPPERVVLRLAEVDGGADTVMLVSGKEG